MRDSMSAPAPSQGQERGNRVPWQTRILNFPARLGLSFPPSWMTPMIYNTFRYGLVLLYLGTLFIVIGYHNPWVSFVRYIGLTMVSIGVAFIGSASLQSCSRVLRANLNRHRQQQVGVAEIRPNSSDSKRGLPSYDAVLDNDLPTYEEAEALRLNPSFLSDEWMKRHSVPVNFSIQIHPAVIPEDAEAPGSDNYLTPIPEPEPTSNPIFVLPQPTNDPAVPDPTSQDGGSMEIDDKRRPSNESLQTSMADSNTRSFTSRPTTSLQRFEDVPEVHLANPNSNSANTPEFRGTTASRQATATAVVSFQEQPIGQSRRNSRTVGLSRMSARRGMSSTTTRPRTSSAFVRSYSSSSFESSYSEELDSNSSSDWDNDIIEPAGDVENEGNEDIPVDEAGQANDGRPHHRDSIPSADTQHSDPPDQERTSE